MISLENVSFSYGKKEVIKNYSLKINEGDRVYLSGKSGSGKTTLLKLILGLVEPHEGVLTVTDDSFAVSFQEPRLLPFRTVRDNISMFMTCGEDTLNEIVKGLGIDDSLEKYPSGLSGGIATRVSVARALAKGGNTYIFDEPFTGLDEESIAMTAETIKKFTRGKTLIAVIHKEEDAEKLGLRKIDFKM